MATWVTRSESGLLPPRRAGSRSTGRNGVVIHWVGGGMYASRDPKGLWRDIQKWHYANTSENYRDIAYNLGVAPGVILEGRSTLATPNVQPGATGNANPSTFAVCALWGQGDGEPSDGLLRTLGEAVRWLRERALAQPRLTGHRDWMSTSCPGTIYPRLSTVAAYAADQPAPTPPPAPPAPAPAPAPGPRMPMPMPYPWTTVEAKLGKGCIFAYTWNKSWNGVWNGTTAAGAAARPFIADLQRGMNSRGYTLAVDGRYGPQTEKMVWYFQDNVAKMGRGPVGPKTWAAIFNTPIKP